MIKKLTLAVLLAMLGIQVYAQKRIVTTDVCVYGGVSAGVIGAYTVTKYGKTTVLIEPSNHLGGMSSSGLGATDIGNKYAITGLAKDFYRRLGQHYGRLEQWLFEPKVAENLFEDYVKRAGYPVYKKHRLLAVRKQGGKITEIDLEHADRPGKVALTIKAKVFMDCSYEGDLMAKAGIPYAVGREDNKEFNETLNGVQLQDKHQFPDGIDPYKKAGDPSSGLLWGISPTPVEPNGTGDKKVQAYNYRLCLTTDPANMLPFEKPAGYNAEHYALLGRLIESRKYKKVENYLLINKLPNNKTDVNHKGGFSLDFIGQNWDYPEASHQKRIEIAKAHENYIKGLLYYLANDPALPEETRESMKKYGWPKDEFKDNGGFPHQLYVREARRMRGLLTMTQHHCQGRETVEDGVGMAAYQMDSHNCQRIVKDGMVKNEGNVEVDLGSNPYPISYRSLIGKESEASNLLVPVCMSATHIAYGSIRMEPVFMVLAQSSAVAAVMAINENKSVQQVDVKKVQAELRANPLADGTIPDVLVDDNDLSGFKPLTNNWKQENKAHNKFGLTYYLNDTTQAGPYKAEFTAKPQYTGNYTAYCYINDLTKAYRTATKANEVSLTLSSGQVIKINPNAHVGDWYKLGEVTLKANEQLKLTLESNGPGLVSADAFILVPKK